MALRRGGTGLVCDRVRQRHHGERSNPSPQKHGLFRRSRSSQETISCDPFRFAPTCAACRPRGFGLQSAGLGRLAALAGVALNCLSDVAGEELVYASASCNDSRQRRVVFIAKVPPTIRFTPTAADGVRRLDVRFGGATTNG